MISLRKFFCFPYVFSISINMTKYHATPMRKEPDMIPKPHSAKATLENPLTICLLESNELFCLGADAGQTQVLGFDLGFLRFFSKIFSYS